MHKIVKILRVTQHKDSNGKTYYKTLAVVNHDEVFGWSRDKDHYKVGDEVMSYFDSRFNQPKMQKKEA